MEHATIVAVDGEIAQQWMCSVPRDGKRGVDKMQEEHALHMVRNTSIGVPWVARMFLDSRREVRKDSVVDLPRVAPFVNRDESSMADTVHGSM